MRSFALGLMLKQQRSGGNSRFGNLNISHLNTANEAAVIYISHRGEVSHFCGLDNFLVSVRF